MSLYNYIANLFFFLSSFILMKVRIFTLLLLALCAPFLGLTQSPTQNKVGGICFRVDDHQTAAKWRDWNNLFNQYQLKFSLAINPSRLYNDTAAANALREIAAAGHELMDHTPDHHMGFFLARNTTEANTYLNHPAVDHLNGNKVCLKVNAPNTEFITGEGNVNLIGNRLISQNNGEFLGINGNPFCPLVYLPSLGKYAVYTSVQNRVATDPDTMVLQTYWQETWPLDTQLNISYHRIRTEDVRSLAASNNLLAERSKQLFTEYGLPVPKTWIQPGGSFALLNRLESKALCDASNYTAAAVNLLSAQKCYNESDPDHDKRFGMQGPDFVEESQSIQVLINTISDRSARHYQSFGLSHMFNVSGGWSAFLTKVDSLLKWSITHQIPVRTYQQWASILYDSIPNQAANAFPLLQKDLNGNGLPDGFATTAGFLSNEGVAAANFRSVGSTQNNTSIASINNLGGVEKGSNLVKLFTKGMPGDSIRLVLSFPDLGIPTQMFMFGAGTSDYTEQSRLINIPENSSRINVNWVVIKRNNPGMVRMSYAEMRKSSIPKLNQMYEQSIPVNDTFAPILLAQQTQETYYTLSQLSYGYQGTSQSQFAWDANQLSLQILPQTTWSQLRDSVKVWVSNPDGFSDTAWFKFIRVEPNVIDSNQTDTLPADTIIVQPPPIQTNSAIANKIGGICFRIDDHQTAANWRALNNLFIQKQVAFTVGIHSSRLNDTATVNALREIALAGNEIADHTPDHALHFFNVNNFADTLAFVGHPGVAKFVGKKVCLKIDSVQTENYLNEGTVRTSTGNLLISENNGEWSNLSAPTYYSNIFIPAFNSIFTYSNLRNKNVNDPDTITLGGYWGEPINLPIASGLVHHRLTQYDIKSSSAGINLLMQRSKSLFALAGLPEPKTFLSPSGNYAMLNRAELKSFATANSYSAGGIFAGVSLKCYNEEDANEDRRYAIHGPDFREENTSAAAIINTISDNSARHFTSFGLSSLLNMTGGMPGYLARIDSILTWAQQNQIPVRTFNQWASILYDSTANAMVNVHPLLQTDLNKNLIPDGFSNMLASLDTIDGVSISAGRSLSRSTNGNFASINNLGGLEKGDNVLKVSTKGFAGDSIRIIYSFPDIAATSYSVMIPANTSIFTEYLTTLTIPFNASRMNITYQAVKRTIPGAIKMSGMQLHPAVQQQKRNLKETPKQALQNIEKAEFLLFPNPVNSDLNLASNLYIQEIKLMNISGAVVLKASVNQQEVVLQLGELPHGMYFLQFSLENGETFTKKILKN
jgi:hypothetical protein